MIDKKPPKLSVTDENDDFDDDSLDDSGHGAIASDPAEEPEEPIVDEDQDGADAMVARQKRNGLIITYGTGAVFFAVIAFLAWPHFKHYFVSTAPVQQSAYTPVPDSARKSYFTGNTSGSASTSGPASESGTGAAPAPMPDIPSLPPGPADTGVKSDNNGPVITADTDNASPANPTLSANESAPGVTHATGTMPSSSLPPASGMQIPTLPPKSPSLPVIPGNVSPPPGDFDTKIIALQATIDKMTSDQQAQNARLTKLETAMASLQTQIAGMSNAKSEPVHHAAAPTVSHHEAAHRTQVSTSSHWVLRSAVPGMALISRAGSQDLQRVSVGDIVTGLGKITSIEEHDSHWVVQGASGSVSQ